MEYNPKVIEKKWQKFWEESGAYEPKENKSLPKKYILSMFPYPSGNIHMGHVRNYCISDAIARKFRKDGYNVLHPIGWDAFGMPAENAAIKHKTHPKKWTYSNIKNMKSQLYSLGFSFSKTRELATCDLIYSKWEQSFFIAMWEKGLIYRKKGFLNWCPNDQTVLANEQVIEGKCWRCDTPVVQKEMYQYYIKITDYAEELLRDLDTLEGKWPNQVLTMQKNWIGKSEGLSFSFDLEKSIQSEDCVISALEVFTTRPDTIFGVSYCALAPEHPLVKAMLKNPEVYGLSKEAVEQIQAIQNTSERERAQQEKMGIPLGIYAIHPLSEKKIPLWVANFVLMGYGSGAVMSVPAHDERDFEFAKKYNLPIIPVIAPKDSVDYSKQGFYAESGTLINSQEYNGLDNEEAKRKIIAYFEKNGKGKSVVNYKLRDWGISRQRYWGTPIPLIHCEFCGIVPESLEKLPVALPEDVSIDGEGNPLDKHPTWKRCVCPQCGKEAIRETDTLDTFMESSWYFLRYTTSQSLRDSEAINTQEARYWMDVDEYIGGIEHAILHLLYARFFTKVLKTLGYTESSEPFSHLLTQGMVTKDGAKMSKSKGNVVDPSEIITQFGADTARLFILFAAPPIRELEWNDSAVEGSYRFIKRLCAKIEKVQKITALPKITAENLSEAEKYARKKVYEALKKSYETFTHESGYAFNTLIAACMEALNALNEQDNVEVWSEGYFILLNILEPIIPHICWELSQEYFNLANFAPIVVDGSALKEDSITMAITVNGKRRGEIKVALNAENAEVLALAKVAVEKWIADFTIVKEIVVPNKLVNFVVK
ncbi:leucine--tRNA ligase [Helicobacter winghamensis]|uniref:Leucine--tRNA ligase n=1 Tax=Helicobacter winghamensis TaxID=157268 RepID=A0A2N3PL77_9HELI|nr:leucine--tRNA ligase [Helicobacter winghamensis]PKT79639.1 leucine--tRNA ligase [Helicobacter winghamensis]PKT82490.1 leucine--tRNA ligase [Helicobacter winghamensis]PKT82660.1 leucine--tRNA ligase [Helicobacter winghamensis]